eukprot:2445353-Prymnesium_polylepis.1
MARTAALVALVQQRDRYAGAQCGRAIESQLARVQRGPSPRVEQQHKLLTFEHGTALGGDEKVRCSASGRRGCWGRFGLRRARVPRHIRRM